MSSVLCGIGLIFMMAGLLSVVGISDFLLAFVQLTQIHNLPLLNIVPAGWIYLLFGVLILMLVGNAQASGRTRQRY